MVIFRRPLACAMALAGGLSMMSGLVQAEIQFNGFMSVGAGMTFDEDEQFAGYEDSLSFRPDSVVGLQASADLGDGLSATAQLVARGNDDSKVKAEWLYLSYQALPDLRVNVGRQRMPLYMYSDFLEVGYAYHWLRPPTTVYSSPISSYDGLSALYSRYIGDLETTVQVVGGSYQESDVLAPSGARIGIDMQDYIGGVLSLAYEPVTLRATYHQASLGLSDGALFNGLQALRGTGAGSVDLRRAIDLEGIDLTFMALGMTVDVADILFVARVNVIGLADVDCHRQTNIRIILGGQQLRLAQFGPSWLGWLLLDFHEVG